MSSALLGDNFTDVTVQRVSIIDSFKPSLITTSVDQTTRYKITLYLFSVMRGHL